MPSERYRDRHIDVYLPSEKFLEKWKATADASRMALSPWIFSTVEASIDGMAEPAQETSIRANSLAEENRKLRRDIEKSEARLRELETQLFKVQNESRLQDHGIGPKPDRLIEILQSGGTWSGRDMLKELGINPDDAKAIQIVSKQLESLQDFGLVSESARGWKWIR
jgi:hypothetical protein